MNTEQARAAIYALTDALGYRREQVTVTIIEEPPTREALEVVE
jgi:hypothetical protein